MKWNDAYKLAEQYYNRCGNLFVPLNHIEDGYSLGRWIEWQRRRYSVARKQLEQGQKSSAPMTEAWHGVGGPSEKQPEQGCASQGAKPRRSSCTPLTEEQIARLDSIGMVWNLVNHAWEHSFAVAEAYYKKHGNLNVSLDYCADGVNLNSWIRTQRRIRNRTFGNRKNTLTEEQIRRLDSIGMEWNPQDARWEHCFAIAEKYYREHGNLNVPKDYEEDGVNLNRWLWTQRRIVNGEAGENAGKLTGEQIRRLEGIGMEWKQDQKGFSYYYDLCRQFYEEYGHTDFPEDDIIINGETLPESGKTLAAWKKEQENADYPDGSGSMSSVKRALLHKIGIGTTKRSCIWNEMYNAAAKYYKQHGDLLVPFSYVTDDGINLGNWISKQRKRRRGMQGALLTDEQVRKLDAIGMSWDESGNRGKRKTGCQLL